MMLHAAENHSHKTALLNIIILYHIYMCADIKSTHYYRNLSAHSTALSHHTQTPSIANFLVLYHQLIIMGATTLENALIFIAKVNKVLAHTAAKDRLVRLIQYLMKFLTFSLSLPVAAAKARTMELLLIDARKVFRFFRFMESFVNMQRLFTSLQQQRTRYITSQNNDAEVSQVPLKLLQLIQQSSLFAFFLSDHALLLSKLSITSHDPIFLRQLFGGVWLVSCLSGVGADVLRLHSLHKTCRQEEGGLSSSVIDKETSIPACIPHPQDHLFSLSDSMNQSSAQDLWIEEKRQEAQLENRMDLILNSLNAFIALNLTKKDMPYHRGVVGGCGIITSSIQLWQLTRNHTRSLNTGSSAGSSLAQRLEVPRGDDYNGSLENEEARRK